MKKIKLLTAVATVGMTSGLVLPLVTSCNKTAATGTIKFKLADGISADPVSFKVGDKVVVTYSCDSEDAVVTASDIKVKFDGWLVQPSRDTWGYNIVKKQITIYHAPTTDITVVIHTTKAAQKEDAQTQVAISLRTPTETENNFVYYWQGSPDDYITELPSTYSAGQPFISAIDGLTALDTVTGDTTTTFRIVDGQQITDESTIPDSDVTIEPIWVGSATEPVEEQDFYALHVNVYEDSNGYALGRIVDYELGTKSTSGNLKISSTDGTYDLSFNNYFMNTFGLIGGAWYSLVGDQTTLELDFFDAADTQMATSLKNMTLGQYRQECLAGTRSAASVVMTIKYTGKGLSTLAWDSDNSEFIGKIVDARDDGTITCIINFNTINQLAPINETNPLYFYFTDGDNPFNIAEYYAPTIMLTDNSNIEVSTDKVLGNNGENIYYLKKKTGDDTYSPYIDFDTLTELGYLVIQFDGSNIAWDQITNALLIHFGTYASA